MTFCAAIEAIDKTYIRQGIRKHREQEVKYESLMSQLNCVKRSQLDNQVLSITAQLSHASCSLQIPQNGQLPGSLPPPQNNCQAGPHQLGIITEEEKALVCANVLKYIQHHNTPEGHTAYFKQLCTWKAMHGENAPINAYTPFLLHPGTVPMCSRECYTCRMQGHMGMNCTAMGTAKILLQEGKW